MGRPPQPEVTITKVLKDRNGTFDSQSLDFNFQEFW